MILSGTILSLVMACAAEHAEPNYLPGKWNLVQSAFYENDSLKATATVSEIQTVYYFSACETSVTGSCDMYVEEDGEQHYYAYLFDPQTNLLILDEASVFKVESINENTMCLVREYEHYRSAYLFVKSE